MSILLKKNYLGKNVYKNNSYSLCIDKIYFKEKNGQSYILGNVNNRTKEIVYTLWQIFQQSNTNTVK